MQHNHTSKHIQLHAAIQVRHTPKGIPGCTEAGGQPRDEFHSMGRL